MLQNKSIAYVRTTGEKVFLISVHTDDGDTLATVRRPVTSETGIYHEEDTFYVEELESEEEYQARQQKEAEEFVARFRSENALPSVLGAGN